MIPQAYTARDIGDAYKWSQSLPPHVRDELKTVEQMVLSYLKAKATGQLHNYQFLEKDAQKKSQEFQKTLQNLKTEMDQFSENAPVNNGASQPQFQGQQFQTQPQQLVPPQYQNQPQFQGQPAQPSNGMAISAAPQPNLLSAIKMDPKSRQILNELRDGLNLSTDMEVVRMALVLAHKTLKQFVE